MNLTISLEEPLAGLLRQEASARSLSPEQAASDILRGALGRIAEEERWLPLNRLRLDLIRKSRDRGLSAEEGVELDRLQAALDARLQSVDDQMIATVEAVLRRARGLRDASPQ